MSDVNGVNMVKYCNNCTYGALSPFPIPCRECKEFSNWVSNWKLTPYKTAKSVKHTEPYQSYYSAGDESEALCPDCECSLDDYDWETRQFSFCPECGLKLKTREEEEISEGEEAYKEPLNIY